jgi:hypothetical protein
MAENIQPRESEKGILNRHVISIQGILGLESRKYQQLLDPFDLSIVCLHQKIIIESLCRLQIITCVIQCRQI